MADALDSKSSDRKVVRVQVPPPVLVVSLGVLNSWASLSQVVGLVLSPALLPLPGRWFVTDHGRWEANPAIREEYPLRCRVRLNTITMTIGH
jgi:hypothetical protein